MDEERKTEGEFESEWNLELAKRKQIESLIGGGGQKVSEVDWGNEKSREQLTEYE